MTRGLKPQATKLMVFPKPIGGNVKVLLGLYWDNGT